MKKIRKAYVLSSFTSEPVEDYLKRGFEQLGSQIEIEFGPYFQIMQELSSDSSPVFDSDYDVIILWMRFTEFYENSVSSGQIDTDMLLFEWEEYIELIISASQKSNNKFVVVMPAMMLTLPLGKGDVNTNNSVTYLQESARCLMMKKLYLHKDILLCDEEQFFYTCGRKDALSPAICNV